MGPSQDPPPELSSPLRTPQRGRQFENLIYAKTMSCLHRCRSCHIMVELDCKLSGKGVMKSYGSSGHLLLLVEVGVGAGVEVGMLRGGGNSYNRK